MINKGAMTFGEEGKEGARTHDLKDVEAILDVFQGHGHFEVFNSLTPNQRFIHSIQQVDTARVYTGGTSEEYLGKVRDFVHLLYIGLTLSQRSVGKIVISSLRRNFTRVGA